MFAESNPDAQTISADLAAVAKDGGPFFRAVCLMFEAYNRSPGSWYAYGAGEPEYVGPTERQMNFYGHLLPVHNDLDIITAIVHRSTWVTNERSKNNDFITDDNLASYVQADVHAFIYEYRSMFDAMTPLLDSFASKKGQLPSSFNDLHTSCNKDYNRTEKLIGAKLTQLIGSATWFEESTNIRDNMTHFRLDAFARFMDPPGRLVFVTAVGEEVKDLYKGPTAFQHNGWVFFDAYAGYYVGRALILLNSICEEAAQRLDIDLSAASSSTTHRMPTTFDAIKFASKALASGSCL